MAHHNGEWVVSTHGRQPPHRHYRQPVSISIPYFLPVSGGQSHKEPYSIMPTYSSQILRLLLLSYYYSSYVFLPLSITCHLFPGSAHDSSHTDRSLHVSIILSIVTSGSAQPFHIPTFLPSHFQQATALFPQPGSLRRFPIALSLPAT